MMNEQWERREEEQFDLSEISPSVRLHAARIRWPHMNNHQKPERSFTNQVIPTVSRVLSDTLVELVYDREKRKTALVVSRFGGLWNIEQEVRIETGEVLIPYSATNNLIANECVLLPSKPVEHGQKAELLGDIRNFLHRYVDLSPLFEQIAAHYIMLTWVHDAFGELPYLRLRGEFGTGKTRSLLAIGSLCYKPFFASAASTVSPIFHTLDAFGGTLILDEADLPLSDARVDLVKILNNGSVRGMPVLRTIVNRQKEFNPQAFRVFAPKVIAMRHSFDDPALESRFITEETGTRPLRADIPLHLPPELKADALELRNRLLHFRLCHFYDIKTDVSAAVEGIDPRLNQTAMSLLSIVDDGELRQEITQWLIAQNAELADDRRSTPEGGVLIALAESFAVSNGRNVSIREVTERFNTERCADYGGPVANRWIAHIIRKRLRIATRKSDGVSVVPTTEKPKVDALMANLTRGDKSAET